MSIPIVIPWLPVTGNTAAVAPVQTLTAAGPLALNANVPNLPNGPYRFDRVARTVTITGAGNFTITGIGSPVDANGNPTQVYALISEVVAGGATSVNVYVEVSSIVAAAAGANYSAGFGATGVTDYVFLDYNRTMFQTTVQVQVLNYTAIVATVYQSLSKPQTVNTVFGNLDNFQPIPAFAVTTTTPAGTHNQIGNTFSPVTMVWATMSATAGETLYFTVLQQGLRS